ncbi:MULTISPECIES: fluoride efflux transporter CrcB [Rhizobium]|uniref:Fluoride-specific ion channel FluC n=1 Tax=Rhizobium paranaense TaxID=1650438 RepID=A0A7W8XY69_9HYPH|nr:MULTISPECIES: fluoride efflux transporter CrcB [Rhizobium]MBB5577754.1 CrcB protein [Rhizobium paranaense]PST61717.1 fluoride efflux transporter CrcB [Rhizobium sp. SEMIA4064]
MNYLIVFLGAGLGGAFRLGVNQASIRLFGLGFPYGTLVVNVVGSLIMGLLTEYFVLRSGLSQELRLFLTTGILGGFTTFSTFSLDAIALWERGQWASSLIYIMFSVFLSLAALVAGLMIIRLLGQSQTA